jgi:hypothetical protein
LHAAANPNATNITTVRTDRWTVFMASSPKGDLGFPVCHATGPSNEYERRRLYTRDRYQTTKPFRLHQLELSCETEQARVTDCRPIPRWCFMKMNLVVVLVTVVCACNVPTPTRCAEGTVDPACVTASPDGGRRDAGAGGGFDDGDFLSLSHAGFAVPDLLVCWAPRLVHTDGTDEGLSASSGTLSVEVTDSSLATPAEATDCPAGQVGVIGVAPGTTTARITLDRDGMTMSVRVSLDVRPYSFQLRLADQQVPLNTTTAFWPPYAELFDASNNPVSGETRETVSRWVTLSVADTSIATIAPDPSGQPSVHGLKAGSTSVTAQYAPAHTAASTVTASLRVLDGTYTGTQVLTVDTSGSILRPGQCYAAGLTRYYSEASTGTYYPVPVAGPIQWTSSAPAVVTAADGQLCAMTRGSADVKACGPDGQCTTRTFGSWEQGWVTSISAQLTSTGDVPYRLLSGPGLWQSCPPVRATATFSDGSTRDVTEDPLLAWTPPVFDTEPSRPPEQLERPDEASFDVTPPFDAAGDPCFYGTYYAPPTVTMPLHATSDARLDDQHSAFEFDFGPR